MACTSNFVYTPFLNLFFLEGKTFVKVYSELKTVSLAYILSLFWKSFPQHWVGRPLPPRGYTCIYFTWLATLPQSPLLLHHCLWWRLICLCHWILKAHPVSLFIKLVIPTILVLYKIYTYSFQISNQLLSLMSKPHSVHPNLAPESPPVASPVDLFLP